jgi:hypothetical protein
MPSATGLWVTNVHHYLNLSPTSAAAAMFIRYAHKVFGERPPPIRFSLQDARRRLCQMQDDVRIYDLRFTIYEPVEIPTLVDSRCLLNGLACELSRPSTGQVRKS